MSAIVRRYGGASVMVAALLGFAGCGAEVTESGDAAPSGRDTWTLVSISPAVEGVQVPIGEVTLTFDEARAYGTAGCNTFHLQYEIVGTELSVLSGISTTRRMCRADGAMELERAYLRALGASERVERDASRLTLRGPEGTLVFAESD